MSEILPNTGNDMSMSPAQPNEGPENLPTPALPSENELPAQPGEGPVELPTPSLPSQPTIPSTPSRTCPVGYRRGVTTNNQSFTDLLLDYDVSYSAMRGANPTLPTSRIAPGTVFCAPPVGTRKFCVNGGRTTYIMAANDTLDSIALSLGVDPGRLLRLNPNLAPRDFIPGRVICLP